MKVVLDTNVLISAIMFGGKSREILEMGISGKIKIAVSQDILARRANFYHLQALIRYQCPR